MQNNYVVPVIPVNNLYGSSVLHYIAIYISIPVVYNYYFSRTRVYLQPLRYTSDWYWRLYQSINNDINLSIDDSSNYTIIGIIVHQVQQFSEFWFCGSLII